MKRGRAELIERGEKEQERRKRENVRKSGWEETVRENGEEKKGRERMAEHRRTEISSKAEESRRHAGREREGE